MGLRRSGAGVCFRPAGVFEPCAVPCDHPLRGAADASFATVFRFLAVPNAAVGNRNFDCLLAPHGQVWLTKNDVLICRSRRAWIVLETTGAGLRDEGANLR
jgi:hypothetical protein